MAYISTPKREIPDGLCQQPKKETVMAHISSHVTHLMGIDFNSSNLNLTKPNPTQPQPNLTLTKPNLTQHKPIQTKPNTKGKPLQSKLI